MITFYFLSLSRTFTRAFADGIGSGKYNDANCDDAVCLREDGVVVTNRGMGGGAEQGKVIN